MLSGVYTWSISLSLSDKKNFRGLQERRLGRAEHQSEDESMDSEEEYGQSIAINVIVILSPLEAEVAGKAFFEQSNACDNS